MGSAPVVLGWLEELNPLTKSLYYPHVISSQAGGKRVMVLFPHAGVVTLCLAISRTVPHPDERSSVSEEHKETKHKDIFKRLPEG